LLVEDPHNQLETSSTETSGGRVSEDAKHSPTLRLRLSTRIIISLVAIQALMLFAITWNSVRLINSSHADLLKESVDAETKLLVNSLAPGLAVNDRAILEDVLSLLIANRHYIYIIVHNVAGEEMASLGKPTNNAMDSSYQKAHEDGVYDVESSIALAGQLLGTVRIGYSLESVNKIVSATRNQNAAIAVLGLFLCVLVTVALSLYMTRNLRKLEEGAHALQRGELGYRINVKSQDEIGDVARSFNALAEHLSTTQNMLERKHSELQRETRYLQTLLNGIDAVVVEAKLPDFRFSYVSQEAENLLGYPVAEWLKANFWRDHIYPEDRAWMEKTLEDNVRQDGSFMVDFRMVHELGHLIWVRAINNVEVNEEGETVIRGLILDIMEQKTAEDRIVYLAEHDSLTGLINRRRFQEELERSIAFTQRYKQQGALLFIDLDQFKYINDTYGHQYGDEYLLDVSRRLAKVLRKTDILGRLGGDEFGVIIPSVTEKESETVANALLGTLSQEMIECDNKLIHISASIGIAFFPTQGYVASDLLAKADAAMYTAKNKGRSQYHIFSEDDDELWNMQAKIHWEERIRWALENNRLVLHFQPVADLHTKAIVHYEVLLRMQGRDDELITPPAFIETAERFGLIREIDRWVLRNAIKEQARRRDQGEVVTLAVNISGRHFGSSEIMLLVKESMENYKADPRNIIFEVTETAAVENLAQAREFIDSLRSLGCRFALDDFGIGFSSFHYLRNLPVDFVKIDGSFVRNLHYDAEDRIFVKAMVDLATGLGITCIAEFVENTEIVTILKDLGVGLGQGYHIARPQDDTIPGGQAQFL
jgi:diguanylate cyclase (GGDEF)-like protein/PAS domain S-box-containing protein